jgi:hypothetical protein
MQLRQEIAELKKNEALLNEKLAAEQQARQEASSMWTHYCIS